MRNVLIAECMQEISSFNPVPSGYEDFAIQRGDGLLAQAGLNTAVGGALEVFGERDDLSVVPTIGARAGSAGPLSASGWSRLRGEILDAIAGESEDVAGLYFSLHGAMGAEAALDPEGALLEAAREIVGEGVPIVISLDLHGVLTARMLRQIDGLAVYHTYPHVDFADTGARAARLLLAIMDGRVKPVIARVTIPALVRGDELLTETGCYGGIIGEVRRLEREGRALVAGMMIGNPFTDVPELCSQAVVVTDDDIASAEGEALRLAEVFWDLRARMQARLIPLGAAVAEARTMSGPLIFTDAADATSSGASGDSNAILRALLDAEYQGKVLLPIVDRPAAEAVHRAGVGATIEVALGGALDPRFTPVPITAEVDMLSRGKAVLETSGHALDAGPSAVLVSGNVTILVMSRAVSLFDRAMFLAHGRDPRDYDLIVVKSPYCEHHMFDGWAERTFNIDAPGATSADVASLGHRVCRRPIYPLDRDMSFQPVAERYRRAAARNGGR